MPISTVQRDFESSRSMSIEKVLLSHTTIYYLRRCVAPLDHFYSPAGDRHRVWSGCETEQPLLSLFLLAMHIISLLRLNDSCRDHSIQVLIASSLDFFNLRVLPHRTRTTIWRPTQNLRHNSRTSQSHREVKLASAAMPLRNSYQD